MRIRSLFTAIILSGLLVGCASYQLGTNAETDFDTVFVRPAQNSSTLPQIEAPLTSAIRKAIESQHRLNLAGPDEADTTLEVIVVDAARDIAAVLSEDVGRGRKFELVVTLSCSLRDNTKSDTYYFQDRLVVIRQDTFIEPSQVNAEFQATPEIARKAAVRISEMLVDTW